MMGATEEQLRRFLGHSESANTIRVYIHLAGKPIDRKAIQMLGAC